MVAASRSRKVRRQVVTLGQGTVEGRACCRRVWVPVPLVCYFSAAYHTLDTRHTLASLHVT